MGAYRKFDVTMLVATAAAGVAALVVNGILYQNLKGAMGTPLLMGLLFLVLAVIVGGTVFAVSKLSTRSEEEFLFLEGFAWLGGILAVLVVLFLLAMGFEYLYELEGSERVVTPTSYIFIIDESGSMAGNDPDCLRYDAIEEVMAGAEPDFPYAVYAFSNETAQVRPMLPASQAYPVEIPQEIRDGGTYIRYSLEFVMEDIQNGVLDGGDCPKVVLLTDGVAHDLGFLFNPRAMLSQYKKAGISISAVGLGSDDENQLRKLTDATGGVYVHVENAGQISSGMLTATTVKADRDLLSTRPMMDSEWLYVLLRILFLTLLGACVALLKAMACAQSEATLLIAAEGAAAGLLGAILVEIGTASGTIWLWDSLYWLLLAVTPSVYRKQQGSHGLVDIYYNHELLQQEASGKESAMSGFVGKVVNTLIVVILVVVCLVSLRDMILTDNAVQDAFVAIFEPLPFSGQIAELICKTMGYQLGFQTQQAANTFLDILVDLVKIFAMTIVNPLIIRPVARLFLRVPDYLSWQDREAYMERPGYRVKECLIMVLLTPLSAYLASLATGKLLGMVYAKVGFGGLVLVSVVSLVLMILLSCLVLTIFGNFKFGFVLRYRLGFQLIDGLLKVVGINILCIFAGLAFYNDHGSQGLMMILLLCIYLAGIDLLMGSVFQPKGA